MAKPDAFEELAQKVQELWLEACRARLERLAESWDPWIRAMLTEPLPDDWLAEIDRFVENTRRSTGLIIAPHSIGQIEDLIRDRAGGTGVFAAVGPAPVVRNAPVRTPPSVRPGAVRPGSPGATQRPSRPSPSPPGARAPAQPPGAGVTPTTGMPEEGRRYYTGNPGINAWLDENYDFGPAREQLVKNWWDNQVQNAAARSKQQYDDLQKTAELLVKAGLPRETADRILREAKGPFLVAPGSDFDPIREAREKLWQAAATAIPSPNAAQGGGGGNKPPVATIVSGAGGDNYPNKRGPKTDPDAAHNAKICAVAKDLEVAGNKIIAAGGGRAEGEQVVKTPGGYKEARRPDIIYRTPDGDVRGINIGLADADGNPIPREREALEDLNGPGQLPTTFVPYNN